MCEKIVVGSPSDALVLLREYARKKTEHFGIIALDSGRRVIEVRTLFIGCVSSCNIDIKVIFWELCRKNATAFIVYHNHPCGDSTPSSHDLDVTMKIKAAADVMQIKLLDHVIMAEYGHFSFLEHDLIVNDVTEEKKVAEK